VVVGVGLALVSLLVVGVVLVRVKRADAAGVEQVRSGIYRVRNFISDVYVARAGDELLVFDAGLDPEGRAIDLALRAAGATRADVTHVLLTHAHADHVAGAGLFSRAKVHIGAPDLAMLAQREPARPLRPRLFGAVIGSAPHAASAPLRGRESIPVGSGMEVIALPFPGHTPGSYVFWFAGVLFTGDSILREGERLAPAIEKDSVDSATNRESIQGLSAQLGELEVKAICTGHMGCTTGADAKALLHELAERVGASRR
jgi:glyoxylase-like metal-dependent hydrolase (beta-lactamase superfamily II)